MKYESQAEKQLRKLRKKYLKMFAWDIFQTPIVRAILSLLNERDATTKEIKEHLDKNGIRLKDKQQLYNALQYLKRKGKIRRKRVKRVIEKWGYERNV
jgi:DNA-binding PadR family transcriptional regulator